MSPIKTLLTCLLCCTLACGCRRKEQAVIVVRQTTAQAPETDPQIVEFRPLARLVANRATHLAADSLGNVYWTQETPSGQDTLFVAGQDDIPQPIQLTTSAIIAALGPPNSPESGVSLSATAPNIASGNIQSIALDSDDNILFFFNGGIGRSTCICLGTFNPRDQSIHILAGTPLLAAQDQMGTSIGLAQGQIILPTTPRANAPMRYWLWLHHSDAAVFLRFDPRAVEPGQPVELSPAFDHLSGDGAPANLTDDRLAFSAGEAESLWMIDWRTAWLWRVDENGVATKWMTLLGLPRELSALTARDHGIAIAFAPAGEPAAGSEDDQESLKYAHFLNVHYPALIAIAQDSVSPIAAKEDMHGPPEVNIAKLRLQQFLPTSKSREWIGYDAASGMLMRIRLTPKS